MRRICAVIVDDNPSNISLLTSYVKNYCSSTMRVVGTASRQKEAISLINKYKPEILFLDIMLQTGTSFEILERIEPYDYRVIFATAYDKFALKAFKYNAVDYLMKPIDEREFLSATNKVCNDILERRFLEPERITRLSDSFKGRSHNLDFITVPSVDRIEFVRSNDIIFCKSDGRYTEFHLEGGRELVASKSLGEFQHDLDKGQFFRIHHSYIVNLMHVLNINKSAGNYIELSNGKSLPIAKRRQQELHRYLNI